MTGYRHLSAANEWPLFNMGTDVVKDADTLRLKSVPDGFLRSGAFFAGPFESGVEPWFRVRVIADDLQPGEHVEIFTFASDATSPAPLPTLSADQPFSATGWRRAPRDLHDLLIAQPSARRLWLGGVLRGDGTSTPRLRQIRIDHGRDTAMASLPAIYGRDVAARERLERLLALHEAPLRELETTIADLPRLFDPAAAAAGERPSWLAWLAGWLDFDLTERWTDGETREFLAGAFALYGERGTIEGLRRYLKMYCGVEARITEPAATATFWTLGQTSTLGFSTRLAPGSAQGAVLDATATLDASHMTRGERFGETLFEDVAHRFCVDLYCADLRKPGALDDVRAVLDREKPAQTVYRFG